MTLYSDRIRQVGIIGFLIVYVVASYLIIVNLSRILDVNIGEDVGVSNLIFWCLCVVPVLLLVNKKWVRSVTIVLSILIVLVTGKRSATIAIALVLLTYILDSTSSGERKKGSTIGIIIFVMVLYFVISRYLEGTFLGVINRLGSMQEDRGSGRLTIYQDVINVLKENNFADWLVGRGRGSIKITRHSNAHNDALQMLFEFGIVGLIGYIMLLVYIFKRLIVLRKSKSTTYLSYATSVIITVVLGLVSNLVVFHSYFAFICAYWGIVEAEMVNKNLIRKIYYN
jgi:O-antigen ligase